LERLQSTGEKKPDRPMVTSFYHCINNSQQELRIPPGNKPEERSVDRRRHYSIRINDQ
jgi:hypothetical protein